MDEPHRAHDFDLDDEAQRALAVALETSGAIGDDQCGTEYLLYGAMATARGDVAELAGLFALDPLRLERGIHKLRQHRFSLDHDGPGPPPLTARAQRALSTPRADGTGPTGVFELLHGLCEDEASGACQVLRDLGVRPAELRRLVAYGTRHLEPEQLDELLDALDRRDVAHRPWWGPRPEAPMETMAFGEGVALDVAASESATLTLRTLAVTEEGFGLTLGIESLRPWLLPPVLQPEEVLVPGQPPLTNTGPELVRIEVVFSDGSRLSNLELWPRWTQDVPTRPVMVNVGSRTEQISLNDRRRGDHHVITSDWWIHPLPPGGPMELRVEWPAEALRGSTRVDCDPMLAAAQRLPERLDAS
ncbi:MAG: hypothetical protein OEW42_18030 [Acidimicrobiia bacterium]|nr:hypothetical protein [Acidimicrobiia bacterium]